MDFIRSTCICELIICVSRCFIYFQSTFMLEIQFSLYWLLLFLFHYLFLDFSKMWFFFFVFIDEKPWFLLVLYIYIYIYMSMYVGALRSCWDNHIWKFYLVMVVKGKICYWWIFCYYVKNLVFLKWKWWNSTIDKRFTNMNVYLRCKIMNFIYEQILTDLMILHMIYEKLACTRLVKWWILFEILMFMNRKLFNHSHQIFLNKLFY